MKRALTVTFVLGCLFGGFAATYMVSGARGETIPPMINYQGRVEVNGIPFDGSAEFKFALTNVAGDSAYAEIKKKLAAKLMENLKLTGDPRATGGGDRFDEYPYFGGICRHPGAGKKKKK